MIRQVLGAALIALTVFAWAVQADDPVQPATSKKDDAAAREAAVLQQERLAQQYRSFEQALLRLAQRLERSSKLEDREKAVILKEAIRKSSDVGITTRFDKLITTLKASGAIKLQDISDAMGQSQMLAEDIRSILALLMSDNRAEQIKAEKEYLRQLMEMLDKVIRDQKVVRAQNEVGRLDKGTLGKAQNKVTESTKDVARAMDKNAKDKAAKGKEGDKSKQEDKGKDGDKSKQGDKGKEGDKSKDGDKGKEGDKSKEGDKGKEGPKTKESSKGKEGDKSKDGDKGKEGDKSGDPSKDGDKDKNKEGSPSKGSQNKSQNKNQKQREGQQKQSPSDQNDQQPPEVTPGRKQVQDALGDQQRAEKNIEQNKKEDASKDQDSAIKKLEDARKKLEELLRQLREEEMERLLADLQARCERMLQMQLAILEDTVRVDQAIGKNADRKPTRAEEQKSLQLSDREEAVVREANKAIDLLQAEGSAVAFAEVFFQVRDDMRHVARRLGKVDVAHVTQAIEQDIIDTLKEMVDALKKAQQEMQNQKQQQQQQAQSQPPDQALIDLIAELRMIRSMQLRVNSRTQTYGKQYQGEQAADPDIQKELSNLAQRQQKIFEVTNNIARGKNK